MSWWKFARGNRESLEAAWLGEKMAEMLSISSMRARLHDWHDLATEDSHGIVAAASLRVVGFRIGSNQASIVNRIDAAALMEVHHSLIAALIERNPPRGNQGIRPFDHLDAIMKLSNFLTAIFYANAKSAPPLPLPHWYVGKDVCMFLQHGAGVPNPEEVMVYAEFLSESMRTTKQFLDELLDAGIVVVQSRK